MKVNIAIIEKNQVYRESLKTALSQIPDFEIVYDADDFNVPEDHLTMPVHLILLDDGIGKNRCNEILIRAHARWPSVKFLFLTSYREVIYRNTRMSGEVILKNSSKKEFEKKMKNQLNRE